MSIKLRPPRIDGEFAEAILRHSGAASICMVQGDNTVATTVRIRVTGGESIAARIRLPLQLKNEAGTEDLVPVVVFQSNPHQTIQVSGLPHRNATEVRSAALGRMQLKEAQLDDWQARERAYWQTDPIKLTEG